ncbi:MAG: RluA family pseudouridine synthase [Coriobacteriia bacterium]|nr:RluA family pseudouridine synthase [Coriobacteriia bacterium]
MPAQKLYVASTNDLGKRLDVALADAGLYPTRSAAGKAIEDGLVLVNGQTPAKKQQLRVGDTVIYQQPTAQRGIMEPQDIPLDIRFEDDHLLVLSKQVGLVCHPAEDHYDGTLVNALLHHCGADHLCSVQGEDDDRLGIVHRLDRDTSGLMLAAKTDEAGFALMDAIRLRNVDRHYLALVHGNIAGETGMIDAPLTRHPKDRLRMAVKDVPQARDAITTFTVLARYAAGAKDDGFTLIDCKLFTGRTHQIRAHLEYTRHPLVGEPVYTTYGPKAREAQLGLNRQFLHSYRLGFEHPATGERMDFLDNPPADLQAALTALAPRETEVTPTGQEIFAALAIAPHPTAPQYENTWQDW